MTRNPQANIYDVIYQNDIYKPSTTSPYLSKASLKLVSSVAYEIPAIQTKLILAQQTKNGVIT